MTDPVIISLVGAASSFAAALLAAIVTITTLRMSRTITTLEKNTNSIKDALVKTTGEAEHAKGKLEGRAEVHESFAKEGREEHSG